MKLFASIIMLVALALPAVCQTFEVEEERALKLMGGYLYQTAITPESYLITNEQDLKSFVSMIPPVTPYKNLPPPPNPDPFLKGVAVDFEKDVLVVAVGRSRIENPPVFEGIDRTEEGRRVHFSLTAPTAEAYPLGYAVYTAVFIPRVEGPTTVVVTTVPAKKKPKWSREKFQRL